MEVLYTRGTFKTKKALVEAVKAGQQVYVYSESIFGTGAAPDGKQALCGPGPYDRRWYASITVEGGMITQVK